MGSLLCHKFLESFYSIDYVIQIASQSRVTTSSPVLMLSNDVTCSR